MAQESDKDTDELTLTFTRRELNQLVDTLRKAEEVATAARASELDFRMQRMRLERKLRASLAPTLPPPDVRARLERADTKPISLAELKELTKSKG